MARFVKILFLLSASYFIFLNHAFASDFAGRWYQIELIVFSHITSDALTGEAWPNASPTEYNPANAIQLSTPNQTAKNANFGYQVLARSAFTMAKEQSEIARQSNYHVLLHLAWRQQVMNPRQAKAIHIYGGNVYNSAGKVIATDEYGNLPYSNQQFWQIDGTFKISVRRYFDVNVNLLYAAPADELSRIASANYKTDPNGFVYFRLLQSRRMRSQELNYIGHPLFGVLVKVTPIKDKTG